ncbi:hypothetical protein Ancab_005718, partial [Ancistrocladus abbreviatus]
MGLKLLLRKLKTKGKGHTKGRRKAKRGSSEHGEVTKRCDVGEDGAPVLAEATMLRRMTSSSSSFDSLRA